jgi:uridine phosphorylase
MMKKEMSDDQLVLNNDKSIYHLNLLPTDLADTVILVGDPDRVSLVSDFFDYIEIRKQKREFITHTGTYKGKRVSVVSTGIGLGNIDIVMNELDALVNINFKTRKVNENLKVLNIIRIGTCGGLTTGLPVGATVISSMAFSFDTLFSYYKYKRNAAEATFYNHVHQHFSSLRLAENLHVHEGDREWVNCFSSLGEVGYTMTCSGFYAPQFRRLRIPMIDDDILGIARDLEFDHKKLLNFEMESSAIYGFGRIMGHRCCSISCVATNRVDRTALVDYSVRMNKLIEEVLEVIVDTN